MIAPFHAAQVHHAVHHGDFHVLALAGAIALVQRGKQSDREMQAGSRVADLRARDIRRTFGNARGAHRAAHGLRDVLIRLEVGIGAGGAEALDGTHHHARIDFVDLLPRESEPVEHAGPEILHDDVALLQQLDEYRLAVGRLHVDRDRALVAVQHREIQAVRIGHVAQLAARRIARGRLQLDHVRSHPRQQLRAGRPRLHVRHVENADSLECFHLSVCLLGNVDAGFSRTAQPTCTLSDSMCPTNKHRD